MFSASVIASAATASTQGLLYQAGSAASFFSVKPQTRPVSYSSVLREREVRSETIKVTPKQMDQAQIERQKFPAIGLP